jgi:hypothetical protein
MTLLSILFLGINSLAQTQIAFIEIRDPQGKVHQLEPGGRFSHIAISYQGKWLHTHPYYGVQLVMTSELEKMGQLTLVEIPRQSELLPDELQKYMGRPYDSGFSWESEGYYCSKLVGKILHLPPEPMNFSAAAWNHKLHPRDNLGLSPDDIFRTVLTKSFDGRVLTPRCESVFLGAVPK